MVVNEKPIRMKFEVLMVVKMRMVDFRVVTSDACEVNILTVKRTRVSTVGLQFCNCTTLPEQNRNLVTSFYKTGILHYATATIAN
jgi:hypothetical protein